MVVSMVGRWLPPARAGQAKGRPRDRHARTPSVPIVRRGGSAPLDGSSAEERARRWIVSLRTIVGAVILVGAFCLGGCVHCHQWSRPGSTSQEFYQDAQRCRREHDSRGTFCWGDACQAEARRRRLAIQGCLRALGWQDRGPVRFGGEGDEMYARDGS